MQDFIIWLENIQLAQRRADSVVSSIAKYVDDMTVKYGQKPTKQDLWNLVIDYFASEINSSLLGLHPEIKHRMIQSINQYIGWATDEDSMTGQEIGSLGL
jgi:hypothetical protein